MSMNLEREDILAATNAKAYRGAKLAMPRRIGLELANAFGVFMKIETDALLAGALW